MDVLFAWFPVAAETHGKTAAILAIIDPEVPVLKRKGDKTALILRGCSLVEYFNGTESPQPVSDVAKRVRIIVKRRVIFSEVNIPTVSILHWAA